MTTTQIEEPLKLFAEALRAEERKFLPVLASDNLGLLLRSAINELDWYDHNLSRNEHATPEQEEQFYVLRLGVTRLMKLSLEARPSFDAPTVTFCRDKHISESTLQICHGLGMIEHGRRVAQTVSTGLSRIELIKDKEFLITLPAFIPDEDHYERAVSLHYREQSRRRFAARLQCRFGTKMESDVRKLLTKLVYPFATHYIGYGADPLLDTYFFGIATSEVQCHEGYDTFHYAVRFGGIRFQKYILALKYLVSIFIRHRAFAEALVAKEPSVKLENILTISSETEEFVQSIREAVNYFGSAYEDFEEVTLDEAGRIFDVLSLSRRNTNLLGRPAFPTPLLIQCSGLHFIRCLTGARNAPMQFLLESLRYHFPADYNRHQQSREKSMQAATKRVLNGCFSGLHYLDNIKLKSEGRLLTDIDLVVLEESTGTLLLCQLKHQELCGEDFISRHNRATRLRDEVSRWLATLDEWTTSVGESGIRASFRLSKKVPRPTAFRIIVSRHHGYPIRPLAQRSDTAYANWVQFVNSVELLNAEKNEKRRLHDLVAMLKKMESLGGEQQHADEPPAQWIIRDLKFTVVQQQG